MAFGISAATWGMVGATAAIGGAGIGAFGAKASGDAAAAAAMANAQMDMFNANIAAQNAQSAASQGRAEKQAVQRSAARTIGNEIAQYGASGVAADSGSPMDVLAESARLAALDSLTSQYNTALKVRDFQNQQKLDQMAAAAGVQAAQSASTSSLFNAGGAVMQGVSGAASFLKG